MDPVTSASAIAMQHRAPQACTSCRRLKRKCVFNPALGICNRCSETSRSCVYAEVNPTAPHDDSVAVVHHNTSTTSMNAGARLRLILLARHSHPPQMLLVTWMPRSTRAIPCTWPRLVPSQSHPAG
ncbi:hypothetical protein BDR06DRAFT_90365 [Suillus hirtellus]|nr:hypothetical protein BDR06DRAFT_90365 [Suillus hirtellus]